MAAAACFPGRFDGRVAIVTGGADGLGKGIAKRLVAEGAKVRHRPLIFEHTVQALVDTVACVNARFRFFEFSASPSRA